jgi:hypothetical protein
MTTAINPVIKPQLPRDEERERLTADFQDCRKEEHDAADELAHPRHGILYPAYLRLRIALQVIRAKCSKKYLALTTYRKKMQHEANSADLKVREIR